MKIDYWHNFEEGAYYHIYNHSVSHRNIFMIERDYHDFLNKCKKYLSPVFQVHAYCLMPNHFHLVVKVKNREDIIDLLKDDKSKAIDSFRNNASNVNDLILDQFRRYFSSYALSYNFYHKTRGQLFLKRIKRILLNDYRLLYMICYIHHNPIHHGFVRSYDKWKYSSFHLYEKKATIQHDEIFHTHFKSMKEFYQIHYEFMLDQANEINIDIN